MLIKNSYKYYELINYINDVTIDKKEALVKQGAAWIFELTTDGYKKIEDVEKGDKVIATEPETGEMAVKEVLETYVNETDELIHLTVNSEEITTTPTHMFFVPQKGWAQAIDLRAGDILVLVNGEYVIVEKTQHEILETSVKVYNFQVEDFHTYHVGKIGVLTHNKCDSHHVFPQKIIAQFEKLGFTGIDSIHNPKYKVDIEMHEHRGFSYEYNKDWESFLEICGITKEDALDFGRILSEKYGYKVNF